MRPRPGPVGLIVRGARWALPWLGVLALSASLASAVTRAVTSTLAVREPQASISTAASLPGPSVLAGADAAGDTQPGRLDAGDGCDISVGRLLYVGLNTWIPAEPRVSPCPDSGREPQAVVCVAGNPPLPSATNTSW
jgi:hypothetical protein